MKEPKFGQEEFKYRYIDNISYPERDCKKLIDIIKKIKPISLLEIGCGNGRNIRNILNYYPDIECYGCDISKDGINKAKSFNKGTFFVCSPHKLNNICYDVILSFHALERMQPIIKEVVEHICKRCNYLILFEPFFDLQNKKGKMYSLLANHCKGIPYLVTLNNFEIIDFYNTGLGRNNFKTGLLTAKKTKECFGLYKDHELTCINCHLKENCKSYNLTRRKT